MTDNGRFAQFRFRNGGALVLLSVMACASAPQAALQSQGTPEAVLASQDSHGFKPINLHAELSRTEAKNGTVVIANFTLPEALRSKVREEAMSVEFEGIETPFFAVNSPGEPPGRYQAIVGIPYDRAPGPARLRILVRGEELLSTEAALEVIDGGYPQEVLHVKPKHVTPPDSAMPRIDREVKEIVAIYRTITRKKYWSGPLRLPIASDITSPYGSKRVYNGELKSYHGGIDLKAAIKTPIRAAAAGRVALAKNLYYTGNTVMLDHGYGIYSLYAHMSSLRVKRGQVVPVGKIVGLSGMTGRVTGPHLHWQIVINRVKVDPVDLMKVLQ